MPRNKVFSKGLVVGIILLFIGAGVYPAIAVKLNTSINAVQDEKSNVNAKIIEQLSDLPCNCEKNNKTNSTLQPPAELCEFLRKLGVFFYNHHLMQLAGVILLIMWFLCQTPLSQNI
jgi:hypothetical protein